jgi:FkbM family methyltransferase
MKLLSLLRSVWNYRQFAAICRTCRLTLRTGPNITNILTLREIFIERCYADYFPFYQKAIIVDIGAHKGFFTLFASLNTAPGSQFICLEPLKENYEILKTNLHDNSTGNCTALHCGIYTQSLDNVTLYLGQSVSHSLYANKSSALADIAKICTITLRDLIATQKLSQIDFLKMDCEGAEYAALMTADPETLSKIKTISMEFHDLKDPQFNGPTLAQFLENNGFRIVKFVYERSYLDLNYGKMIAVRR